ncbi:MAG: FAD-dependent oxidoreductase [Ignavibacteria bacterium]|nr:FAD-dependent oxidoreductase [Ignavibacteria bacterium]
MSSPIKIKARVNEIISQGEEIYTIRLGVPCRATRFKAGQFLHLTLDEFDPSEGYWPESRVFSIASKPGCDFLEIVYSVKGQYTSRMSKELFIGREVWVKLPYGDFIVNNYLKNKDEVVLIAGGTGISPFIPFILEREEKISQIPLTIYYGIRNKEHFLYHNVIENARKFAYVNVIEGFFDIDKISNSLLEKQNVVCFISGPPTMIKLFKKNLSEKGFPNEFIVIDAWE